MKDDGFVESRTPTLGDHIIAWFCSTVILSLIPILAFAVAVLRDDGPLGPMNLAFIPVISLASAIVFSTLSFLLYFVFAFIEERREVPRWSSILLTWLLYVYILSIGFSLRSPAWIAAYGLAGIVIIGTYQVPLILISRLRNRL
ncbi:MAG TPA: hypothetical protein VGZ22_07660 [Isosphaeraceae bacterium]|jgi:hypothetical protein|nr:hypothetical protein [Isosphaeraceae bacterium]